MIKRPMNAKDVVKYTRDILRRRKIQEGYKCVLCHDAMEETMIHLSFYCSLVVSRLFTIGIQWEESANIFQKLLIAKNSFSLPFFMEIFMVAGWCICNKCIALISLMGKLLV
jgi:hypothetical protein